MVEVARITTQGVLADSDIFMFGYHLIFDMNFYDMVDDVKLATEATFDGHFGGGVVFSKIRGDLINVATGASTDSVEYPLTVTQGGGGNMLPSEVAICVSLNAMGGPQKGRFYLPPPTVANCSLNGRLLATKQASLADDIQDHFQTRLGDNANPKRVVIYSRKDHVTYDVSQVSVGNVFDSQRRRRNKLVELRESRGVL